MNPITIGLTALGGGILNTIGGSIEADRIEKQKARMRAILEEAKISDGELTNILSNVHKLFNARLVTTLNSAALQSSGIANSNVTKGIVAGALEGQRLQAVTQTTENALNQNKQVDMKLAELEGISSNNNFLSDFLGGAISGGMLGMQATELFDNLKTNKILRQKLFNE